MTDLRNSFLCLLCLIEEATLFILLNGVLVVSCVAIGAGLLPHGVDVLIAGRTGAIIPLDFDHGVLGRFITVKIGTWNAMHAAAGVQVGLIVVAGRTLLTHELSFIHQLSTDCLKCVVA